MIDLWDIGNIYLFFEIKGTSSPLNISQPKNPSTVILAETGWPTAGSTWIGSAQPTPANARGYWDVVQTWAKSSNVNVFWFNSYDEEWKPVEGALNANHWGLFYGDGKVKEVFEDVFTGQTSVVSSNDRVIPRNNIGDYAAAIAPVKVRVSSNMLTINLSQMNTPAQVRLIDMRGKFAAKFTAVGSANFPLSQIPAGRYFVEVRDGIKREKVSVVVGVR